MNKKVVDDMIPLAIIALKKTEIANDGKIDKAYREQISSFGAAISMGSFKAAVAFFSRDSKNEDSKNEDSKNEDSKNKDSKVLRSKLLEAISSIRKQSGKTVYTNEELLAEKNNLEILKEEYIDAAIALKLAMNTFELVK